MRIIASVSVVLIHVSQQIWYTDDISSAGWIVSNFFEASSKWAVPVFVMISGAGIFNYSQITWSHIIKSICKLAMLFCVWGIIYFGESMVIGKSLNECILSVIYGPLWYLLMTIGLYLMVPFVKKNLYDNKLRRYFIILSFVCAIVIPTFRNIISLELQTISKGVDILIDDFNINFCLGYVVYFVAGYSIASNRIDKKTGLILLLAGIASVIINPACGYYYAVKTNSVIGTFYDNFNICIYFEAVAIFYYIFKMRIHFEKEWFKQSVSIFSSCTLGIYLIHKILIDCFNVLNIKWTLLGSFVSIPAFTFVIWLVALAITICIKRIPILKKIV